MIDLENQEREIINLCLIRTAASQEIRWLNIKLIISRSWFFRSIIFPSLDILISELPHRPCHPRR